MHHHWHTVLVVLSAVLFASCALTPLAPRWGDIRVKHTWNTVPANWEWLGPPPAGTTIDVHIALKPHHKNKLIDALYEVSNPSHKKYGRHLTEEQIAELVAPHQDTLDIVHSWLEHHDVPSSSISTSHGGGWLTITGMPVSQADKLLSASYQLYKYTETNETEVILRTVSYALPEALHAHVKTVAPTTHFAPLRTPLQTPREPERSIEEAAVAVNATEEELMGALSRRAIPVRPSVVRWLYRTQSYVPAATGKNVIGMMVQNGPPSPADLTKFMTTFRADAAAATFSVVFIGDDWNTYDTSVPPADASVGTQYAAVIAYPTPQILYNTGNNLRWTVGGPAPGDAYLEWFNYIFSQGDIPRTISIPYANPEPAIPKDYADVLCELFAHLGLRGISVLVASGDSGVGSGDCSDNSGDVHFIPMFPASCPWVTSVGGTTGHDPENAAPFSGGGFSFFFDRDVYQDQAVTTFLTAQGIHPNDQYQIKGRGIPDISAQADNVVFVQGSNSITASSTSCSTPIVAGIISLLNDYLMSTGRNPLGFLNPWLYGLGRAGIKDVKSGFNPGCNTPGFPAVAGWDPVTGLGTLDFMRLQYILDVTRPIPGQTAGS